MVILNLPKLEKKIASFVYSAIPSGKIFVKEGDEVNQNAVLSKGWVLVGFREYNLSKILGIKPGEITSCLKKRSGEVVLTGDIVAFKKGVFKKREFRSPIEGMVYSVDEKSGVLRLSLGETEVEVKAEVSGKVSQIKDGVITVSFQALIFKGYDGLGGRGRGEILCLGDRVEEIGFSSLGREADGKIVILGGRVKLDFWEKACALGVVGILGGHVEKDDFEEMKKDTAMGINGGKRKVATKIVLGGEKDGFIKSDYFESFKKRMGKMAEINGFEKKIIISV